MDYLLENTGSQINAPQALDWGRDDRPSRKSQAPYTTPDQTQNGRLPDACPPPYETILQRQAFELIAQTQQTRTKEVAKVNDYRNQSTYDNPYRHLNEAHQLAKTSGIESALDKYARAIEAAETIDYDAVRRHKVQVENLLVEAESKLREFKKINPPAQLAADIQKQHQHLAAQKQALTEIWLAPSTSRANCAFACINSGKPEIVKIGETLLREACAIRPEIKSDPQFLRHYREAYLELARKSGKPAIIPPLPGSTDTGPVVDSLTYPPSAKANPLSVPVPRETTPAHPPAQDKVSDTPPVVAPLLNESEQKPDAAEGDTKGQTTTPDGDNVDSTLLNKLMDNPIALLTLAAAGGVLVKKGANWFFQRKSVNGRDEQSEQENGKEKSQDGKPTGQPKKENKVDNTPAGQEKTGKELSEPTKTATAAESASSKPDSKLIASADTEVDGKKVSVKVKDKLGADGTIQLDSEGRQIRQVVYEVNGKPYMLEGSSWLQAPLFTTGQSDVKLHVTTISAGDLAKVQATLIPDLFEAAQPGGPLHGNLSTFKTLDVTHGVAPKSISWFAIAPGHRDQNAKGFTLYAKDEIAAKEIYNWLSAKLKERGLTLDGHGDTRNVGDKTRDRTASNRVSIDRDHFEKADIKIGDHTVTGAVLEDKLAEGMKRYVLKRSADKAPGWDFSVLEQDGRLTKKALERLLKECEVDGRCCTLDYETKGAANQTPRLVFVTNGDDSGPRGQKYYLDESNACKKVLYHSRTGEPISLLTGRPAYYRISEQVGKEIGSNLDPAHLAYERLSQSEKILEKPQVAQREIEIRGLRVKVGLEATVSDTAWKVVGQDAVDGHVIVLKLGKPIDVTGKTLKSLDDAKFHKVTIEGEKGEFYRRKDSDEIYKVVEVARTFGEEASPAAKFLVQIDEVVVKGPRSPIISSLYKEALKTATASDNTSDKSTQPHSGSTESIKQASESTNTADEFARKLTELAKSGTIYQALVDCKVDEMTAKDLESRLTSPDERARKKAWEEVSKIGKTRDLESRLKARPGGAGAWALLAAPLAPLLFESPNSPAAGKVGSAPWVK
jgi:hypothetical protein